MAGASSEGRRYERIARDLLKDIRSGSFGEVGRLPSERDLGERFGVQRNTIRRALKALEDAGHIITREKRGSFVNPPEGSGGKVLLLSLHGEVSPELAGLHEGFTQVAVRAGYTVRRYDTMPAVGAALDSVPRMEELDSDVAGIALWPQNPTDESAIQYLNDRIPLVLVDRRVQGVLTDSVRFDDVAGGRLVTNHLISLGHRRIAFLADEVFAETVQHRWQGYAAAHEQNRIPVDPTLSLFFYGIHDPYFATYMREVLGRGDRAPSAIVCANDVVAFVLLRFLRDEGIAVPGTIEVTGYGNLMPTYTRAMGLTSVNQSFSKMGAAAATLLLERIAEGKEGLAGKRKDIRIPVSMALHSSPTHKQ